MHNDMEVGRIDPVTRNNNPVVIFVASNHSVDVLPWEVVVGEPSNAMVLHPHTSVRE